MYATDPHIARSSNALQEDRQGTLWIGSSWLSRRSADGGVIHSPVDEQRADIIGTLRRIDGEVDDAAIGRLPQQPPRAADR